ncbi:acyl-CoA dehydratase activase [Desulfoluna butyratoxydans]|uniref:Atpase badf/badg/bcra/bcrd type n=1 Tax=Desulfoluna butyratoxydans TaxID=231438 RepID=A0A4U8YLN2_9BACT|nr:acyl-CoA dehydratase activase [Desulfoluna butyratoxydans]VFQ44621.1 atpase badf/badg/bcra/bcrd type [Desulfoluna butyratoxydans]
MISAGIDIGSRTIKLVLLENGTLTHTATTDTGFQPMTRAREILSTSGKTPHRLTATGYGRTLFEQQMEADTVTEIKACAAGTFHLYPEVSTILDIGGQDVKVIRVGKNGRVVKFEMNDRCAAGTGKFLEIMSDNLGFSPATFGDAALSAEKTVEVSSMCTVFAESEVTSLLAKGEKPVHIARGLHDSVVRRAASMIRRVGLDGPLCFVGGVAKNPCIRALLSDTLNTEVVVPDSPQTVVAFGAALLADNRQ